MCISISIVKGCTNLDPSFFSEFLPLTWLILSSLYDKKYVCKAKRSYLDGVYFRCVDAHTIEHVLKGNPIGLKKCSLKTDNFWWRVHLQRNKDFLPGIWGLLRQVLPQHYPWIMVSQDRVYCIAVFAVESQCSRSQVMLPGHICSTSPFSSQKSLGILKNFNIEGFLIKDCYRLQWYCCRSNSRYILLCWID